MRVTLAHHARYFVWAGLVLLAALLLVAAVRTAAASSIIAVSPPDALAGSPDLLLTITASDFDTATVTVAWNGVALDAGVLDSTTLTATVPAPYLATAGTAAITLTDAVNGPSEPFTFTIENPVPVIDTVLPDMSVAGAPFTVTLTGSGFVSDTQVALGTMPLWVIGQTTTTLSVIGSSDTFTTPGVYTLTVSNAGPGGGSASVAFTITPGLPASLAMRAEPGSLSTDGVSRSAVTVTVADRYGNVVSAGTPVTLSVTCSGVCAITPHFGLTGPDGSYSAGLTSTLRSVTQTITSTIRVSALVSPAATAQGFVTNTLVIAGFFTPRRAHLPIVLHRYPPLNNHTLCAALFLNPPATFDQAPDNTFNVYRFRAGSASYDITMRNYPMTATGSLLLRRITADHCSATGTMSVVPVTNTVIAPQTPFVWPVRGQLVAGAEYVLIVYTFTGLSANEYTVTIAPRALLAGAPDAASHARLQPMVFTPRHVAELATIGIIVQASEQAPPTQAPDAPQLR